ncbi:hypothetical protein PIROE2DRAFT_3359 [Piromyces sp. E2]|nr:hypothetical protein PIROE2DRAFT_3359 [Piromyces sp. E2]|eukprot:OUM68840.1 hypothetical protein PIROE2DRAFT_3359 [Piromyces sp. E2]
MSLYRSIRRQGSLEYQHWIEIECKHAIRHDYRKSWNWIKCNYKLNNKSKFNHPIKDKNNQLVSSTEEQLKATAFLMIFGKIHTFLSILLKKKHTSDNIPIEIYKAMLSDNDSDSNSGLEFLYQLYNRIWDGDFPVSWNNASIVSIPKKGDLNDGDNYRLISLLNNGIKVLSKIVATKISKCGIEKKVIRPEQFGFRNKEECSSLLYLYLRHLSET